MLSAALEPSDGYHPVSENKWEDLVWRVHGGSGFFAASARAFSGSSGGSPNGFILLGAGTIDSHTLNNTGDNTAAPEPQAPALTIALDSAQRFLQLSWPVGSVGYQLEATGKLSVPN